jgi:1-deoxy-D-xylulose-5-phosphate synthase
MNLLDRLSGPDDVKHLSVRELYRLAAEIRELIICTVTANGGHLASNLGVVELTLALHRVFSTPVDQIVWDVGHQCYTHKILTGRKIDFQGIRRPGGPSGFPKRSESLHDAFDAGHASTSVSAALGLLAAKRARGESGSVIAVIGDGALTGGMVYEAMSHAGQLGYPLLVVLNDNTMSISANVGAVSRLLSRLSATVKYQNFRRIVDKAILMVPFIGTRVHPYVLRAKRSVKALFFKESLFSDLGFEYAGPIDGHNVALLCNVLAEARAIRRPVVIHVVTKKGKGHSPSEVDPSSWHGVAPPAHCIDAVHAMEIDTVHGRGKSLSFTEVFGSALLALAAEDPRIVALTAAMAKGTGLSAFQARYPGRFFDVGIAEEHGVTMAAGMAAGGLRPVVAIYSTFMQRAFDQVHHDVALCGHPVVFAVDRAGAVPEDGETHQGLYDIQAFRAVPGLTILAPAGAGELVAALRWALAHGGPSMIRFPKAACPPEPEALKAPFVEGQGILLSAATRGLSRSGSDLLLIASGALVDEALQAAVLAAREGFAADVYNLRFLKPVNHETLSALAGHYKAVVIAEEGVLTGSVAVDLAGSIRIDHPGLAVRALGFPERPLPHMGRPALLETAGLDARSLYAAARELLG